jgi:hypothetical protein
MHEKLRLWWQNRIGFSLLTGKPWASFLYVPPSQLIFLRFVWMLSAHLLLRFTSRYFPVWNPHLHDPSHLPIHRSFLDYHQPPRCACPKLLSYPPFRCSDVFLSSGRSEPCSSCCYIRDHVSYAYRTNWNDQNTKKDVGFAVPMAETMKIDRSWDMTPCSLLFHDYRNFGEMYLPSITCIHIVAYRPVAKRWLCKQWPFLGNGSVNMFLLLGSRFLIMHQLDYNNGKCVFLRGPCRDVISKGRSQLRVSSVRESEIEDLNRRQKNSHSWSR